MPESFPGVYVQETAGGARTITGVATSVCAFVGSALRGPVDEPVQINSYDEFETTFGGLWRQSGLGYAVQDFYRNGGSTAIIVRLAATDAAGGPLTANDYVDSGFEEAEKGIYALSKADLFTLLCLPPPVPNGDLPEKVWRAALAYCAERRAFLLVDPPGAATPSTVTGWLADRNLTGDVARNGAMYFPRIRRPDPLRDGAVGDFVACGAVAGIIAGTDAQHGVWKAPAGTGAGLAGITGLAVALNDAESGTLNSSGINCLRTFPNFGLVVWGARTLRGADVLTDEYKYVSVRRLALYIEESLYRGTQWAVFEPNDEPLWAQISRSVGAFMQVLFRQGAFQGQTANQAYFVRCGHDTTTQIDIDSGIINILVGFAPVKPAEFVVISIQQMAAGPTV